MHWNYFTVTRISIIHLKFLEYENLFVRQNSIYSILTITGLDFSTYGERGDKEKGRERWGGDSVSETRLLLTSPSYPKGQGREGCVVCLLLSANLTGTAVLNITIDGLSSLASHVPRLNWLISQKEALPLNRVAKSSLYLEQFELWVVSCLTNWITIYHQRLC